MDMVAYSSEVMQSSRLCHELLEVGEPLSDHTTVIASCHKRCEISQLVPRRRFVGRHTFGGSVPRRGTQIWSCEARR